jgi:hypothetical protein
MDKTSGRFQGNSINNLSKYMEFVDLIAFALTIQELVESVCVFLVIAGSIIKIGLKGANQTSNFHAKTKQRQRLASNVFPMLSFMDTIITTKQITPINNVSISACECANA